MRMNTFAIAVLLCLSLSTLVSSFHRDIFLASETIKTLSAPDFRLCEQQQKFLRSVEEKQSRWLFHLRGPIDETKKTETETLLGIKLGGYIPHNTFVVLATREQAERATSSPHVLWVGAYLPEHKIAPQLRAMVDELGTDQNTFSRTWLTVFHDKFATEQDHSQALSHWSNTLSSVLPVSLERLTTTASLLKLKQAATSESLQLLLDQLSNIHQVTFIEPIARVEPSTRWSARAQQSEFPNYDAATPFLQQELNGKLQKIAFADGGIDRSNCFFPNRSDICFKDRNCDANTAHGTAMGSVIFGNSPTFPLYTGLAPEATAVLFPISASRAGTDGTEATIDFIVALYIGVFTDAVTAGANVFVAGYAGDASSNFYDLYAQTVDNLAYNNDKILTVLPAGNQGIRGVGSPGLSKNALVVGSTQNVIEALRTNIQGVPEAGRANIENTKYSSLFGRDTLSSFSSRGPTRDLRFKPDVVFPGEMISTATAGKCALSVSSGTSLAAAGVAAAALLVREYLMEGYYPEGLRNSNPFVPNAVQIKALLIASATGVAVSNENLDPTERKAAPLGSLNKVKYYGQSPDGAFGFGRIQLNNVLRFNVSGSFFIEQNPQRSLTTGASIVYCAPAFAGKRVKVTLVWNDIEADEATSFALVNNLDLVVYQGSTGREFRANGLETFDNTNNVEVVSFIAPANDTYVVIVHGTNIPKSAQKYGLVITGSEIADFSAAACPPTANLKCPNSCSFNGVCGSNGACTCNKDFFGPDCSITLCPNNCKGTDPTTAKGVCDYTTGKCICVDSYTGDSCQTFVVTQIPTVTTETGRSKKTTILAVVLGCIGGICLGLILGFFISRSIMEKQRQKRREELLKGNQKF